MWQYCRRLLFWLLGVLLAAGFMWPEDLIIPVDRADTNDWNHTTFWHPWGASGVHMGIDIFAPKGRAVIAATPGLVIYTGDMGRGGDVVMVLGPKWRVHYYAHLSRIDVSMGAWLDQGETLGLVGDTGNAAGKPPHLHYSIATPIPYPWRWDDADYGWRKMFILNPHEKLMGK